ncbi:MAG: TRAP transporter substrate-binding protein DctP [Sneathiella sp.]|nr:TRAP transporter substrate-binding protein DctP [Sneathiella sp.]
MFRKVGVALAGMSAALFAAQSVYAKELDFAHFLPEKFPPNKAELAFAEAFEQGTGGEYKIKLHFGGSLGGQKEMLDFVANNVVGIASFPTNHYASQFPAYEAFGMSLMFEDQEQVAALYKKALQTLPLTQKTYEKAGVTPFMFRGLDPYVLLCNKPVEKVADLDGLKIRTFGAFIPKVFEELGAVPVNTLTHEVYEAMQRGVVDCAYFSRVAHLVFKIHEVAKYYVDFEFGAVSSYLAYINNDLLDEMSEDQKKAFWAASEKGEVTGNKVVTTLQGKADQLFSNKLTKNTISDGHLIKEKFSPKWMLEQYVQSTAKFGPDAEAVAKEVEAFLVKELNL